MRVLWLSNCEISTKPTKTTGTWLQTMYLGLLHRGVELFNVATSNNVKEVTYKEEDGIKQWLVPITKLVDGLPDHTLVKEICTVIDNVSPDLVHIWGVERFWGLLSARGYINYPTLLEIQGLRYTCAEAYYGGMSIDEIKDCVYIQDFIFPWRRIDRGRAQHKQWGKYEKEIIGGHTYISTQSDWVRASIAPYCTDGVSIIKTKMAVRNKFMNHCGWSKPHKTSNIQLLTIASGAIPYKGLHIALKALSIIKKVHPNIVLKVVGDYQQGRNNFLKLGYVKHLEKIIRHYALTDNVIFIGTLDAEQLVKEMINTHVAIHPSFVESYSLSLAETMAVGVPSVVAYAGAMPELTNYGECCLLYSPNDYYMCASQILRLLDNEDLSQNLSMLSRKVANERNDIHKVIDAQIEIYNKVIKDNK